MIVNSAALLDIKKSLCFQLSPLYCPDISLMASNSAYVENHKQLCSMIRRTVMLAESNSVLILGPRGCGKTALIKSIIKEVTSDSQLNDNLLIVQLNGLLHTDDHLALKDFARQLRSSVVVDESEEISGTFAEVFALILNTLREERKQSCSIMVTLEEFDLFCSHKSQTLLYNLFDVSQSAQTPIIIIGITCRFDVIELLEKRVKSRFSHRQIHLFHSKSIDDNLNTIKSLLTIPKPDHGWNKSIVQLLKDKTVITMLKNWFDANLNYHILKKTLLAAVIQLNEQHPFLLAGDIEQAFSLNTVDGKTCILNGLSVLELALVVCILNYKNRTQEEIFNFHIINSEYSKVAVKKLGMQDISSSVVEKAYQRLEQVEVTRPSESRSGLQNEYRPMRLQVDRAQVQACLDAFPNIPTALRQLASAAILGAV